MSELLDNFKPGDRVRCIDDSDTTLVSEGEVYTVESVHPPYLGLHETNPKGGMNFTRFERVDHRPEPDLVDNPSHYVRWEIQPIEFFIRNNLPGHVCNVIKYVCRAGYKLYPGKTAAESEITDLEKAIKYAKRRINYLEGRHVLDDGD